MTSNLRSINNDIELIIDLTFINNKYGVEDIRFSTDNKKKSSKLSIISDKDKFIYSVINIKINKKPYIKIDKRLKKIVFIYDVKTIQLLLNCINSKYNGYIDINGNYYINNKFSYKKKIKN